MASPNPPQPIKVPDPDTSPEGTKREDGYQKQFAGQLRAEAQIFAQRRGAPKSLDESDFDSAYRHLLATHQDTWADWIRKGICKLVLAFSGAIIPVGGVLIYVDKGSVAGWALGAAGVILFAAAAIIEEVPLGRHK